MSGRQRLVWIALLCVMAACVSGVLAQTGAPAAAGDGVGESMSWRQVLRSGGWLMYVLAGLSVLGVAFIIYFFAVMRAGQVAPRALHREVVEKIRAGAVDDARRVCEYRPCAFSAVVLAALDYMRSIPEADPTLLKDVAEGEGSRQAEALQGQTQYLLDIAVVSPMVGLLGTVFGMLRAFSSVALDIANAKPVVLAAGVSQALITTAFGLIVGIPAMMFYAYFRRRSAMVVSHLESASTDVLTALLGSNGQ